MSTGWLIGYILLWGAVFGILIVLFQTLKIVGMFINKLEMTQRNGKNESEPPPYISVMSPKEVALLRLWGGFAI